MKQVYLRQVLEWRVAMDHGWTIPTGALGKGLKKHLPADIWMALEKTYVGAQLADNWEALAHTLALFRWVAMEVGAHLGYAYPDELHERVRAYVEQIKQMKPNDTDSYEQAVDFGGGALTLGELDAAQQQTGTPSAAWSMANGAALRRYRPSQFRCLAA